MAASIPKKKKLIRIIIILSQFVQTDLNNDITDTAKEHLLKTLQLVSPQMDDNESSWSQEENDAWAVVEEIDAAMDDNGDPPSDGKLNHWAGEIEDALG